MADDLRVRISWINDEASLRAALAQAQQMLGSVQGSVGYGTVGGAPTPAMAGAAGQMRAPNPAGLFNSQGQPLGSPYMPPNAAGNTTATGAPGTTATTSYNGAPSPGGGGPQNRGSLGNIAGYFGRYLAIRAGGQLLFGGVGQVAEQQQTLSDLNRRVGESTNKYGDFEAQVLRTGAALGATRQQMIEVTNQFVSLTGRMGNNNATGAAVRGSFETAKTLGISPTAVAGYEGTLSQYMKGGNTDFSQLRAALELGVANGMRGRENELIKSIEDLTSLIGSRLPTLSDQQMMQMQGFIGALNATGIQGLMGARGEQVVGGLDQFLQGKGGGAQQAILYRQLYAASGGKLGAVGLAYQAEEGLAGKYAPSVVRSVLAMGQGMGIEAQRAIVGGVLGMSQHNAEALIQAAPNLSDSELSKFMSATPKNPQLTEQDKNTKALVDVNTAMQELASSLIPAWVAGAKELSGEIRLLNKGIAPLSGVLAGIAPIALALAQAAGIKSALGPIGKMSPIGAKPGPGGKLGSAAFSPMGLFAGIAGLSIGDEAGTAIMDTAQSGAREDVRNALTGLGLFDSAHAFFDPSYAREVYLRNNPHGALGGITNGPTIAGESGPEAIIPLSGNASIQQMAMRLNSLIGGTGDSWQAFAAQISRETDYGKQMYGNNPFNLRPIKGGWGGQIGVSPGNFAIFDSLESGISAAAQNYRAGNYGYGAVTAAARRGDVMGTIGAIESSQWDAGHYAGGLAPFLGGNMSGGTVNHYLEIAVKQPDGSTDRYKVNLTSPYRNVVTSADWGVSSVF